MSEAIAAGGLSFPKALLLDLFEHMEWADAIAWGAVAQCDAAMADDPLRVYLAHVHSVQRAFLDAWLGAPPTFRDPSHFRDLASVRTFAMPYYASARAFLKRAEQSHLDTPLVLPWADHIARELGRSIYHPTLGETVMQVISHSGYHRGQVNARLRAIGGKPALVDYIAWIWFGRPKPEWT